MHRLRPLILIAASMICMSAWLTPVFAQHDHEQPAPSRVPSGWQWTTDGALFFGFNDQERKFRDFTAWESQNWVMGGGRRTVGRGTLQLGTMLSFEPFTIADLGSPQVFQTGETFARAPLIDYQHPHDLIMELSGSYTHPWSRGAWVVAIGVVGPPAFGPPPFMHRASATDNPEAPLSHHYLDSTHITPGVITLGGTMGSMTLEGSWFHGREPDENRTDIDLGTLDSYSLRVGWQRGPWSGQISGAQLTMPEAATPYDAQRLSASLTYTQPTGRHIAWTAAFGQKREIHGNFEAYLIEGSMQATRRNILYLRAESVAKDILDAGFHPRGVFHRHRQSQVGALTLGLVHDFFVTPVGRFGVGADATGYLVPDNLQEPYGQPTSFHLFVRFRTDRGAGHVHASRDNGGYGGNGLTGETEKRRSDGGYLSRTTLRAGGSSLLQRK